MPDVEGSTVTNPSLILCSPMLEDSGEYVCCVVNKYGTACSQPIRLNVTGGVPEIHIQCNEYETCYGCQIVLECSFESKIPCNDVYWLKCANNRTTEIRSEMMNVEGSTVTNPSLILCSPLLEDSGEYVCCVVNKCGTACSQPIRLNVTGGVPKVHIQSNTYETCYGYRIVLECSFESKIPCNDVYWLKCVNNRTTEIRSEMQDVEGSTVTNPSLILCSPMFEDSGEYVCCVVNKCGTSCSKPIKLNVTGGVPEIHIQSNNYETFYHSQIVLECTFESKIPCNDVYWLKCANNRTTEIRSEMLNVEGSTVTHPSLILCSPIIEDSGEYVCCVGNTCGIAYSQPIILNVIGDIPEFKQEEEFHYAESGDNMRVSCKIFANPPCQKLVWKKWEDNGFTTIYTDSKTYPQENLIFSSLIIENVTGADTGEYYCFATNELGTSRSSPFYFDVNTGTAGYQSPVTADQKDGLPVVLLLFCSGNRRPEGRVTSRLVIVLFTSVNRRPEGRVTSRFVIVLFTSVNRRPEGRVTSRCVIVLFTFVNRRPEGRVTSRCVIVLFTSVNRRPEGRVTSRVIVLFTFVNRRPEGRVTSRCVIVLFISVNRRPEGRVTRSRSICVIK
ncbi:unnamed protein product [Mytilus coruscus]|uniref:Ig-like domain-containing protein n=1 Tax=Mytilus coruscus TaxID=42192 RepID=A0A6J8B003_MYTCO|nr:unnamed protein product [Mytilus coruscus]